MKICVDTRSLQTGTTTGVERYVLNLLEHLIPMDTAASYRLLTASWKKPTTPQLHFVNASTVHRSIPSKIVSSGLSIGALSLDGLVGGADVVFMPNINYWNVSKNAKLALTVHDLSPVVTPEYYDLKRRLWQQTVRMKAALERADVIFAVSDTTANDLERIYQVPRSKILTTYPGVDHRGAPGPASAAAQRDVRNRFFLPGSFCLMLGTLEPRKNIETAIEALALLPQDVHLVLAGRLGWRYRTLLRSIQKSPAKNRIHVLGYVADEHDTAALTSLASVLLYPSRYEGFGFPPLEAARLGTPSVISNVSSMPEVSGACSLTCDPVNPSSVAAACAALITDRALARSLALRGSEVSSQYTWKACSEKTLAGLHSILKP